MTIAGMSSGTIIVSAILIIIVALIIRSMVKNKKAGKHIGCPDCNSVSGGTCDCGTCPSSQAMLEMAKSLEQEFGKK